MTMHKPVMRAVIITAVLVIVIFIGIPLAYFMSGGWDYRISLPNGYEMVRIHSGSVAICDSNTVEVIGPNIDRYTVVQDVVAGHVVVARPDDFGQEEKPGYFILDTRTGSVRKGLSEKQWIYSLSKYGVSDKPSLRRPMRPILLWPKKR